MASPRGPCSPEKECCPLDCCKERGAIIGKFKWLYIGIWLIGKSQPKEAMNRQLLAPPSNPDRPVVL